jgi:hypothetical protein
MTQAKKHTLNQSMEKAIKQLVYNPGSTLESKLLVLRVHSIESRANLGAGARGLFADPLNSTISRPVKLAQGSALPITSRFPVAAPGPESSSGSAGTTSALYAASGGDWYCSA